MIVKDKSTALVIVLAIIALILGVAIFNQKFADKFNLKPESSTVVSTPTPPSPNQGQRVKRSLPAGLSEKEKELLNPPSPDASKETRAKHYALVVELAKETDALVLNKCEKPDPLVMKLRQDKTFKINNNDSKPYTVKVTPDREFKVEANSTKTFTADFGRGMGSYGYFCDGLLGVVGFFLVTK